MSYKILNDLVHVSKDNFVPLTQGHNCFMQHYARIDAYKIFIFSISIVLCIEVLHSIDNNNISESSFSTAGHFMA